MKKSEKKKRNAINRVKREKRRKSRLLQYLISFILTSDVYEEEKPQPTGI